MKNEKYSGKDFTGQSFASLDANEFNNSEIIGSCFAHENRPGTQVFPSGITGVSFQKCNLDNVFIPSGNTVDNRCLNRRIMMQNDQQDWVVDELNKPLSPCSLKVQGQLGLSVNPADLPADLIREVDCCLSEYEPIADVEWIAIAPEGNKPPGTNPAFWFKEIPTVTIISNKLERVQVVGWNGTDKFHFDALPILAEEVQTIRNGGSVTAQILEGIVTRYRLRGKCWRFRGEK